MSDTAAQELPRFVVFGQALTDFIRTGARTWESFAGGAPWNIARVAATLGAPTGWAGAVSRDRFGEEIVAHSRAAGLDMRFAQAVDRAPLLAMVHETDPPRYFFLGNDAADLAFDEHALPAGWERACEYAHFGCISLVREPLGARLVEIAERLKRRGVQISFDPNYRNLMGDDYPALFEHVAGLADIVKLSDEDLSQIYPDWAPERALAHILELAPQTRILLTLGAEGMRLVDVDGAIDQPVFPIETGGDTVGAGDACMGGFIASLIERPDAAPAAHLRFSAATAAAACSRSGAYAPARDDIERVLNENADV